VKASKVLYGLLGVASATAHKALQWMHGQGVIGYFAGKNGAGIRIFINRATDSIGVRAPAAGKKILPFAKGSNGAKAGSPAEPAFSDSFADLETLDSDVNSRAPKNGADQERVDRTPSEPTPSPSNIIPSNVEQNAATAARPQVGISLEDVVTRLRAELEPAMQAAARQAAAREHERTREWLENRGLPKAARVAQHEAFNVLRKYGVISETAQSARTHTNVGRGDYTPTGPHPLSQDEVAELAQACVAMLETKGQSVDVTLSEMSAEAGGFLLSEDAPKVREQANSLLRADGGREEK
jgi:hypothetical protein